MSGSSRECKAVVFNRLLGYEQAFEIQNKMLDWVYEQQNDGVLMFLQHKPVVTFGKSTGHKNLLVSEEALNKMGIELHETNRGGDITYHGPGQLVVYPILNLRKFNQDAHWYLRSLEEVIIQTLKTYGISAGRKASYTGVWVEDKKITAVGVHLKKWITMHGLAFNIEVNKTHFNLITPCGISDFGISSLNDYIEDVHFNDVQDRVIQKFEEVFDIKIKRFDTKLWRVL